MTDLLRPPARPTPPPDAPGDGPRRPLALTAAVAGATAAGGTLVALMAVALVGWFATDAGAHGTTRDALRVGADAWLLSLGAHLDLPDATVGVAPLGLTLLAGYVAFRLGRWAGETSADEGPRGTAWGVVVLAGVYGVVAVVTAVLASSAAAQPHLARAFLGGVLLALVGGGAGIARGSGHARAALGRCPRTLIAILAGAVVTAALGYATAAVVLTGALVRHLGPAANVLSELHTDTSGAVMLTVVGLTLVPNAVLLTSAYLLGPGFAVGAGTLVSPGAVVLGPLPAFPLLAALPHPGPGQWWSTVLVGVPALVGVLGAVLTARRLPAPGYEQGVLRGLGGGALAGLLVAVATAMAGGAVGPGRMTDVGAPFLGVLVAAVVALGVGGALGGLGATWWQRRRRAEDD